MAHILRPTDRPTDLRYLISAALVAALFLVFPVCAQQQPIQGNNLPDLATVAPRTTTLQSTGSGLRLEDTQANSKVILTPEYSDKTGASLGAAFALSLGERAALGLLVNGGAKKAEVLLNAGVRMDDQQRLIFSAGQLRQTLDYAFASGTDKATTVQTTGALSYEWRYAPGLLQSLELNAYLADTPSFKDFQAIPLNDLVISHCFVVEARKDVAICFEVSPHRALSNLMHVSQRINPNNAVHCGIRMDASDHFGDEAKVFSELARA